MDEPAIPFYYKDVESGISKGPSGFSGVSHSSQLPESPDASFKKFIDNIPPEWIKSSRVGADKKLESMGRLFNFKLIDPDRSPVYQNGSVSKDIYATTGYRNGKTYVIFDLSKYKVPPNTVTIKCRPIKKETEKRRLFSVRPTRIIINSYCFREGRPCNKGCRGKIS